MSFRRATAPVAAVAATAIPRPPTCSNSSSVFAMARLKPMVRGPGLVAVLVHKYQREARLTIKLAHDEFQNEIQFGIMLVHE